MRIQDLDRGLLEAVADGPELEYVMKKLLAAAFLGLAMGASLSAHAHETPARHGGIVKSAGERSFELVNKDGNTTIYVYDHGKEVPMAGASGTLTVLKGAAKTEYPLAAGVGNAVEATGQVRLERGNKAVAAIIFPDKGRVSVRFAVK
jgi:ribosomal protein S11